MKTDSAQRKSLIRLASALPKGSKDRRTLLAALKKTSRRKEVTLLSHRGSVSIHVDNRSVGQPEFRDAGDHLGDAVGGDDIPWAMWEVVEKDLKRDGELTLWYDDSNGWEYDGYEEDYD